MALDFPNAPITGATFPGPNGALWQWDGEKWTAVSTSSTGGGGGASIVMQPSPPALAANALWWDTIGGQLYVCYDDGVGPLQWVTAANIPGPPASQVTQTDVASAQRNVGRNLIHNGLFTVWQRGTTAVTTHLGYSADRWQGLVAAPDTISLTRVSLTDADRAGIGDEEARYAFQNTFVGNTGGYCGFQQRIENVQRLGNKTVIISFYAVAASGTPKIGINLYQVFGTGGSPSATVIVLATGLAVTAGTTWVRYSVTIPLPSVAGKAYGTNNDDYTLLRIYNSAGTTQNQQAGNIGVQSGIINIWGVQLEIAAPGQVAPTPLEKMDAQQTLAVCQRFYCTGNWIVSGYGTSGLTPAPNAMHSLPVPMRAQAQIAVAGTPTLTNASAPGITPWNTAQFSVYLTVTATGAYQGYGGYTATADL
jgi:hypothetical protein